MGRAGRSPTFSDDAAEELDRALSLALSVAMIAAMQREAAGYFTLTSKSITDGARMPPRFARGVPGCPLTVTGTPFNSNGP